MDLKLPPPIEGHYLLGEQLRSLELFPGDHIVAFFYSVNIAVTGTYVRGAEFRYGTITTRGGTTEPLDNRTFFLGWEEGEEGISVYRLCPVN